MTSFSGVPVRTSSESVPKIVFCAVGQDGSGVGSG